MNFSAFVLLDGLGDLQESRTRQDSDAYSAGCGNTGWILHTFGPHTMSSSSPSTSGAALAAKKADGGAAAAAAPRKKPYPMWAGLRSCSTRLLIG